MTACSANLLLVHCGMSSDQLTIAADRYTKATVALNLACARLVHEPTDASGRQAVEDARVIFVVAKRLYRVALGDTEALGKWPPP
jgi:hypothetical protein